MAFTIANLPETLKVRTLDNQVVEITGKLINESTTLMKAFEIHESLLSDETFEVPVHSSGLKNTVKLLEFFDLDKPYNPEDDRLECQRADHPGRRFLDRLSNKQKSEIKHAIEYLECDRLDDCLSRYISDIIRDLGIYDIIPEFLTIRTTDNQVIKIPRKLFEEFETLQSQVRCGNTDYEQIVYFKSSSYSKVLKVLDLCDLDTRHVPLEFPAEPAPLTPDLLEFARVNQPVMDYFNKLMSLDLYEITKVVVGLDIPRIYDLLLVYVRTLDNDRRTRLARAQQATIEYFRYIEGSVYRNEGYVMPAEGA